MSLNSQAVTKLRMRRKGITYFDVMWLSGKSTLQHYEKPFCLKIQNFQTEMLVADYHLKESIRKTKIVWDFLYSFICLLIFASSLSESLS